MSYGLTHSYGPGTRHPRPGHESNAVRGKTSTSTMKHGSYNHDYEPVGHGYSVQSSVLQSSGRPDEDNGSGYQAPLMNRMDSEGDGDYRINPLGENVSAAADGPAGYDLQGIGGQEIHDTAPTAPPTQGRVTRESVPLMTHPGTEEKESDYDHPKEGGFRYRNSERGI